MATLSDAQSKALREALWPAQDDPAALGPIKTCNIGSNKMTRLKYFEEWLEEAESRMSYIGTSDDKAKVILLKSWDGTELVEFMKVHAKVVFERVTEQGEQPAVEADT